jgi:hypothetical protein
MSQKEQEQEAQEGQVKPIYRVWLELERQSTEAEVAAGAPEYEDEEVLPTALLETTSETAAKRLITFLDKMQHAPRWSWHILEDLVAHVSDITEDSFGCQVAELLRSRPEWNADTFGEIQDLAKLHLVDLTRDAEQPQ